jgi:hypothetical protein
VAEQSSLEHRGHSVLWIALAAALSPVLVDTATHVATNEWARGTAVFPFLLAYCAWTDMAPSHPSRDGLVLLVIGVAVSFIGVGGGMPRVGRPGLVFAVLGLARMTGRPSLGCALLALWLIPLPTQLIEALAPGLDAVVASAVAQIASATGIAAHVEPGHVDTLVLVGPAGRLDLLPGDAGLPLAWTFAGLGWFKAVRLGRSSSAAARFAGRWMLMAIPLQVVALAAACAMTLLGRPALGRAVLDHFPLVAVLLGLVWATRFPVGSARGAADSRGVPSTAGAGA